MQRYRESVKPLDALLSNAEEKDMLSPIEFNVMGGRSFSTEENEYDSLRGAFQATLTADPDLLKTFELKCAGRSHTEIAKELKKHNSQITGYVKELRSRLKEFLKPFMTN